MQWFHYDSANLGLQTVYFSFRIVDPGVGTPGKSSFEILSSARAYEHSINYETTERITKRASWSGLFDAKTYNDNKIPCCMFYR